MGARNQLLRVFIVGVLTAATCIAGCTSSTVSQDPFLKTYVDQMRFNLQHSQYENLTSWSETWVDSNTSTLNYSVLYTITNTTPYTQDIAATIKHFKTVDEANQFVENRNAGYPLTNTNYTWGWSSSDAAKGIVGPYERAAGHPPSVFRHYHKTVDNSSRGYIINQEDDIVTLSEVYTQTPARPTDQRITVVITNTTRAITIPVMDIETSFNTLSDQNWTLLTPFTKTTNEYGNAVYIGVLKNKTGNYIHTESIEVVKNETEAKDHFAKIVLSKTNEGYAAYDPSIYGISAKGKGVTAGRDVSAEWFGRTTYSYFRVFYGYNSVYHFWWVMTVVQ